MYAFGGRIKIILKNVNYLRIFDENMRIVLSVSKIALIVISYSRERWQINARIFKTNFRKWSRSIDLCVQCLEKVPQI